MDYHATGFAWPDFFQEIDIHAERESNIKL